METGTTTNIRITGIDMTLGEMMVLFLKVGIALLPVTFLLMFFSWIFTLLFARVMMPQGLPM